MKKDTKFYKKKLNKPKLINPNLNKRRLIYSNLNKPKLINPNLNKSKLIKNTDNLKEVVYVKPVVNLTKKEIDEIHKNFNEDNKREVIRYINYVEYKKEEGVVFDTNLGFSGIIFKINY